MEVSFIDRGGKPLRLTVAIPAYNEEKSLKNVVVDVMDTLERISSVTYEILIVDDGSVDGTGKIAQRLADRHERVTTCTHEANKGFAEAQRTCFREARYDWVFVLPGDHQIRASCLHDLLPKCKDADLVLGIRNLRVDHFWSDLVSQVYYSILGWLFGLKYRDFGSFILCRRALFLRAELRSRSAVLITELVVKAIRIGARISDVEIFCYPREKGISKRRKTLVKFLIVLQDVVRLYRCIADRTDPFHKDPVQHRKNAQEEFVGDEPETKTPTNSDEIKVSSEPEMDEEKRRER